MKSLTETIIMIEEKYKKETGVTKKLTKREMKLIKACIEVLTNLSGEQEG